MPNHYHDPFRQVEYLQQALSSDKRPIGFFLGAGCPMAVKNAEGGPLIPDIRALTEQITEALKSNEHRSASLGKISAQFVEDERGDWNIETILSHIRALKAVSGKSTVRGLSFEELDNLDNAICDNIHRIVSENLESTNTPYHNLGLWIDATSRDLPVELFTTNYDLLVEQALEEYQIPFFDGFTGSNNPFFDIRSIDEDSLPSRWARVWKLHGSINWYQDSQNRIVRCKNLDGGCRRVIHPSHLKYDESRRLPYLAMLDRLKSFLRKPSAVLVVCGYSFGDEHINEVLLQGLQSTQTSASFCLLYGTLSNYQKAIELASRRPNMNLLAADGALIGGRQSNWQKMPENEYRTRQTQWVSLKDNPEGQPQGERFTSLELGDFASLGELLLEVSGKRKDESEDSHEE